MVDPKDTNERTVETEAGLDEVAPKVWVKPHLQTGAIAETAANIGAGADGVATCLS
jgi:hypothetical protein